MSCVLIVSPEYASHYFPLSAVGRELALRGHEVVVATGPGLAHQVGADGFSHVTLKLGPGSNTGLMRIEEQSEAEQAQIQAFFAASRRGMVPTLLHQARNRLSDLLWEPRAVARDLTVIIDDVRPHVVLVDHLAFSATAALRGLGVSFLSFHPGHPSAVVVDVPYGVPSKVPERFGVAESEMRDLGEVCADVVARFAREYDEAMRSIDAASKSVANPFAADGPLGLVVNYPQSLSDGYELPAGARLIGSSVRETPADASLAGGKPTSKRPRLLVSLGSFFSERSDLLRRLVSAFRDEPVDVWLARGTTPHDELGPIPDAWTVAEYLPQPALLPRSDLVVTHGGNNTVTESLTAGVPLLVGPLSTDQFAAAADIEEAALGLVFDPNNDSPEVIADLALEVLASDAPANAAALGDSLRSEPGQVKCADLVENLLGRTTHSAAVSH